MLQPPDLSGQDAHPARRNGVLKSICQSCHCVVSYFPVLTAYAISGDETTRSATYSGLFSASLHACIILCSTVHSFWPIVSYRHVAPSQREKRCPDYYRT